MRQRAPAAQRSPGAEEPWIRAAAIIASLAAATIACGPAPSGPADGDGALPTLRESHTIGCEDCTGPEALSVLDFGLRDDGTVVVLNEFEPFVRVFDPAGAITLTLGAEGEGPGELQLPGYLYLNDDGSLRVLDAGRMHFPGYGPDGDPLESVRYPTGSGLVPVDTAYDAGERALWLLGFRVGGDAGPSVARIPFDGSEATIVWTGSDLPGVDEGTETRPAHFAVALGPDGQVALANGHAYRIAIRDADGNLTHELGRDLPRPRKSEEQLEQERQRSRSGEEPDPEAPHFGSKAVQFDDRGRLWVMTAHAEPGATTLDLFDPEEGFLGTLELPVEFFRRIPAFELAGGRLAAAVLGETGNTRIRVWEVLGGQPEDRP